jgi:hypothetical protein
MLYTSCSCPWFSCFIFGLKIRSTFVMVHVFWNSCCFVSFHVHDNLNRLPSNLFLLFLFLLSYLFQNHVCVKRKSSCDSGKIICYP